MLVIAITAIINIMRADLAFDTSLVKQPGVETKMPIFLLRVGTCVNLHAGVTHTIITQCTYIVLATDIIIIMRYPTKKNQQKKPKTKAEEIKTKQANTNTQTHKQTKRSAHTYLRT